MHSVAKSVISSVESRRWIKVDEDTADMI